MKDTKKGFTLAIALVNPKFPHNVGGAVRAASCFGARQAWFTGVRVSIEVTKRFRLPGEERMKGYKRVQLIHDDYFFDRFDRDTIPVAVELRERAKSLTFFDHPEQALYVFRPEDGGLGRAILQKCQRFVVIPTAHGLNLPAAINIVLYDRRAKRQRQGIDKVISPAEILQESRGFISDS